MLIKNFNIKCLHFFLLSVFIISPFVDIYNGYVQQIRDSQTLIPVVFKICIIAFSLRYMFYRNIATKFLYLFFYLNLFGFFYWIFSGYIENSIDYIKALSKLIYPYSVLMFFYAFKRKLNIDILLNYVLVYGLIIATSILITKYIGIEVSSYADDYGYGSKGLFKAGNDIGLSIVLCTCISSYFITIKHDVKYIYFNIILLVACFMVGSVATLFGSVAVVLFLIIQPIFTKIQFSKSYHLYKKILIIVALPVMFYFLNYIVNIDDYNRNKFDIDHLLSGGARDGLDDAFYSIYSNFSFLDMLFGIGQEELSGRIARYFNTHILQRALEIDHLELLGSYGILLGGLLFVFPISYLYIYIKHYFQRRDSFSYWMIILFSLFVFHGIFAGHAFTSITAMTVLAPIMFLVNSRPMR